MVWLLLAITESGVVLVTTAVVLSVPVNVVRNETVAWTEAPGRNSAERARYADGTGHAGALRRRGRCTPVAPSGTCPFRTTSAAADGPAVGHRDRVVQPRARRRRHWRNGLRHREIGLARIAKPVDFCSAALEGERRPVGRYGACHVEDQQRPARQRVGGADVLTRGRLRRERQPVHREMREQARIVDRQLDRFGCKAAERDVVEPA